MASSSCSFASCPVSTSLYGYRPNLTANVFFLAIISLCLLATIAITLKTRRYVGFTYFLLATYAISVAAYAERIMGWQDPWNLTHYTVAMVLSTIGPMFLILGMHLSTRDIILTLGAEHSPLKPHAFMSVFVSADIIAGFIQAFGLAITFSNTILDSGDPGKLAGVGQWIIFAGFIIQTASLFLSMALLCIVFWRSRAAHKQYGYTTFHKDKGYVPLSPRFKAFLTVLPLSILCVTARCVYRIVFFWAGLQSVVARDEMLYIGAEGILLAEALIAMAVFHPAIWLDEGARDARDQKRQSRDVEALDEVSGLILNTKYVTVLDDGTGDTQNEKRASISNSSNSGSTCTRNMRSNSDAEACLDEISNLILANGKESTDEA